MVYVKYSYLIIEQNVGQVHQPNAFNHNDNYWPTMEDYCGKPPNESTLSELYMKAIDKVTPAADLFMQSIGGDILACDHTFKCVDGIKFDSLSPESICKALFTVLNEYKFVISYSFCRGPSASERVPVIKELHARYGQANKEPVMWTDTCCEDDSWWKKAGFNGKTYLDLFHVIHRIREACHTRSGEYGKFCGDLSKCICGSAAGTAGVCNAPDVIEAELFELQVRLSCAAYYLVVKCVYRDCMKRTKRIVFGWRRLRQLSIIN